MIIDAHLQLGAWGAAERSKAWRDWHRGFADEGVAFGALALAAGARA